MTTDGVATALSGRGAEDCDGRTATVIGLGYVGLATSLSLLRAGYRVYAVDVSLERTERIAKGRLDLDDEDDARLLEDALESSRLRVTTQARVLSHADLVICSVPTPVDDHHVPILQPLKSACADIARLARAWQTIVLVSTTYPGATEELLVEPLVKRGLKAGINIFVAYSPERIDPGNRLFPHDRVPRVVGGSTPQCARRAAKALEAISGGVFIVSSTTTAEFTKLFENTFRAVNIALANEFADVGEKLGVDPLEVTKAAATKPYGYMAFHAGPGVGGSCIPADPHYLLWRLRTHGVAAPVISQAMVSIAQRPGQVVQRALYALSTCGLEPQQAKILLVGASYKPGVPDVESSPAIEILEELMERGAKVALLDPLVERVALRTGVVIESLAQADPGEVDLGEVDLVITHTLHPGHDYSWLGGAKMLLDCAYAVDASAVAAGGAEAGTSEVGSPPLRRPPSEKYAS